MMNLIESFFVVLVEVACFLLYVLACSKYKSRHKWIIETVWVLTLSIVLCGISYLFENNFIVKEIVSIVCMSIGVIILKRERIKSSIFISTLYMFLLVIADFITLAIYTSILNIDRTNEELVNELVLLMSKSILICLIIIIRNFFENRVSNFSEQVDSLKFVVFPFLSICIIAVFMSNGFGIREGEQSQVVWGMIFSLVAMNLLMIFYIDDISEKKALIQERNLFEIDAIGQQKLYQSLEEKIELQRSISHEYKNHITYIQALLEKKDYDNLSDYLKKINGRIDRDLDMIDTHNPIINTIINTKYYEAKNKGAVIVCKINDLSEINIEQTDLILLISNLMNNAIEAISQCENQKLLKFKLVLENDEFIISVQNTFNGISKKIGDRYFTTKTEDKYLHGIGLKNVIKIVEKYNGIYDFSDNDIEFSSTVIIPIKK